MLSVTALKDFQPPRRLGDYDLINEIARGGMGIVWLAAQRSLGRQVAIKVLPPIFACDPVRLARFRAEANLASRLRHPQIIGIHEVGDQDGIPYFSMDYVVGQDLGSLARDHPLSPKDAAVMVRSVALAIQHAHDQGVLHRDLKPSNILLSTSGEPCVTDFGLAKLLDPDHDLTLTGEILGSPCFMAPEQVAGRRRTAGIRTDVYGLGGVLFYSLTGRAPFSGDSISATLQQVINSRPVLPSSLNPKVSDDLDQITQRCLAKNPSDRFATAGQLAAELERALRGQPLATRPLGTLQLSWRWALREPGMAVLGSISILLLGGLLAASFLFTRHIDAVSLKESLQRRELQTSRYIADVSLASKALSEGDTRTASRLLDGLIPPGDSPDPRGFEWHLLRRRSAGNGGMISWQGNDPVLDAAPSPSRRHLLVASERKLRVIPITGGLAVSEYPLGRVTRHRRVEPDPITGDAWIADDLGLVRVTLTSGRIERILSEPVVHFAVSTDGTRIAVSLSCAGGAKEVRVLEWPTRKVVGIIPDSGELGIHWAPDQVLCGLDATGRLWEWTEPDHLTASRSSVSQHGASPLVATASSLDRHRHATVDDKGVLRILNHRTGRMELEEQLQHWRGTQIYMSPEGHRLVVVDQGDQRLVLREAPDWSTLASLEGHTDHIEQVRFLDAEQGLVTASRDGSVRRWAWEGTSVLPEWKDYPAEVEPSHAVYSPDGRWISVTFGEGLAAFSRVWLTSDPESVPIRLPGRTMRFAPNGSFTLQWFSDGHIEAWDYGLEKAVGAFRINPRPGKVPDEVAADGSYFACLGSDLRLRIVHTAVGRELSGPTANVRSFQISPNGQWILFATTAGAGLFEPGGRNQRLIAMGNPTSLAFSDDSRFAAVGLSTGRIVVHDLGSRVNVADVNAQARPVSALAFLADTRSLITGADDGSIRFWNIPTWREVARIFIDVPVLSLVSQPGNHAFVATSHGGVRLLGLGPIRTEPLYWRLDGGVWEDPTAISRRLAETSNKAEVSSSLLNPRAMGR